MGYSYSEEGYKRMREAADRGRQKIIDLSERNKLDYMGDPKECPECGKVIPYHKRNVNTYCSSSCSAKSSNRSRKRYSQCKFCGESTHIRNSFCSLSCSQKFRESEKISEWLKGEGDLINRVGCSVTIKKYLLEQCNNKCPKCGWSEIHPITGKVPLEVNHIDGDATKNHPRNLEIVCPNCHSLTPNYRALNKKCTRSHRSLQKDSEN